MPKNGESQHIVIMHTKDDIRRAFSGRATAQNVDRMMQLAETPDVFTELDYIAF